MDSTPQKSNYLR